MEHQFEEFRDGWTRLAAVARREITAGHRGNAADPWPAATRRAVAEHMVEMATGHRQWMTTGAIARAHLKVTRPAHRN